MLASMAQELPCDIEWLDRVDEIATVRVRQ